MVVLSQPKRQMLGAVIRRLIAVRIRPFPQRSLDKALRLAIGARRIGLGAHMAQTQASAQPGKTARSVARAVKGDAKRAVEAQCRHQSPAGAPALSSGWMQAKETREWSSCATCTYSQPA